LDDCVFCRIVSGIEPASVVYSDNEVLAFMDIMPVNPRHLLVIPKAPVAQLSDLDLGKGAHMFKVAMSVADALRRSRTKSIFSL